MVRSQGPRKVDINSMGHELFVRVGVSGCYVTKFAPHKALKITARAKLTFDERVVLHRVKGYLEKGIHTPMSRGRSIKSSR